MARATGATAPPTAPWRRARRPPARTSTAPGYAASCVGPGADAGGAPSAATDARRLARTTSVAGALQHAKEPKYVHDLNFIFEDDIEYFTGSGIFLKNQYVLEEIYRFTPGLSLLCTG